MGVANYMGRQFVSAECNENMYNSIRMKSLDTTVEKYWLAYAAVIMLAYVRIYFGVNVTDEAQYIVLANFSWIGGKYFQNEILLHQLSNILCAPLMKLYVSLVGSTTGIVLYSRHLYFLAALAASFAQFRLLKKYFPAEIAAAMAACILAWTPYGLPCLSYNTIGYLFFGLATAASIEGIQRESKILSGIGAVFWTIAAFAYPVFLGAVFFFLLAACLKFYKEKNKLLCILLMGALFTVCFGLLAASILYSIGIEPILHSISNLKSRNISPLWMRPLVAWMQFRSYLPLWGIITALLLQAGLLWRFRERGLAFFALLFSVFYASLAPNDLPDPNPAPGNVFLTAISVLLPLGIYKLRATKTELSLLLLLGLPALFTAFLLCLSSSTFMYATANTSIYAAIVALGIAYSRLSGKARSTLPWLISVLLLFWNYNYTYWEDSSFAMDSSISSGPYAYLRTTSARAKLMEVIASDVDKFSEKRKSIFFYDNFSAGYLLSNLRPATIHVLNAVPVSPELREWFVEYYRDSNNLPDLVFYFKRFLGTRSRLVNFDASRIGLPVDPMEDYFQRSGRYGLTVDRGLYTVWSKLAY